MEICGTSNSKLFLNENESETIVWIFQQFWQVFRSGNNNCLTELHRTQRVAISEGTRQVVFSRDQGHRYPVYDNYRPKLWHSRAFARRDVLG